MLEDFAANLLQFVDVLIWRFYCKGGNFHNFTSKGGFYKVLNRLLRKHVQCKVTEEILEVIQKSFNNLKSVQVSFEHYFWDKQ